MRKEADFTKGKILSPLLLFMIPVFFSMFIQSLYGAVDLLIVGKFADSVHVSAVATGSQIMFTLTNLVASFSMGATILLGQRIGQGRGQEGGRIIGTGILLFAGIAAVFTLTVPLLAESIARVMRAPAEAFDETVTYIRICGLGSLFIIAYNLIGSIFRGIGDSRTPLCTVLIASGINIAGDLLLVAGFHMATAGAAMATVFAQAASVVISFFIIRKRRLPFTLSRESFRFDRSVAGRITLLGFPIALQDLLVGVSFLIITAIVNNLGLTASAAIGVAEKVCGFIMLVPSAFGQAMAAFVAQNYGAGEYGRAKKALRYAVTVSFVLAVAMFALTWFRGDLLAGIFSSDGAVITAAADYLKAYAIDCLLTCFLFCFIGFFNGLGMTRFVMIQGIAGAFCIRVPVSFFMAGREPVSLFRIGLATPCSTAVQIVLCAAALIYAGRRVMTGAGCDRPMNGEAPEKREGSS